MSGVHFIQQCPTCGRRLQVQLELMGKRLACEHCHGNIVAGQQPDHPTDALHRAAELLDDYELMRLTNGQIDAS